MKNLEIAGEEIIYRAHKDLARVERTDYSDGITEYTAWLQLGAWQLESENALLSIPRTRDRRQYVLVDIIYDGEMVGLTYRALEVR